MNAINTEEIDYEYSFIKDENGLCNADMQY